MPVSDQDLHRIVERMQEIKEGRVNPDHIHDELVDAVQKIARKLVERPLPEAGAPYHDVAYD